MNHRTSRLVTAAASVFGLTGVLAATTTLTPAPAQAAAAEACTGWQHKEFPTSGFNTDVSVKLCVTKYSGGTPEHGAYAYVKWSDGGGARKFDNFDVRIRLERHDADQAAGACDYTSEINGNSAGGPRYCFGAAHVSSLDGGWTADGYVAYNLDADGEGGKTWSLHGSPQIN